MFTPAGYLMTSFPPDRDISEDDFFSFNFMIWVDENPGINILVDGGFPLLAAILPELMVERREHRQGAATRSRAPKIGHLDRVVVAAADALAHVPDDSVDAWITSIPFETMKHYSDDPRDLGNFQADAFIARLTPVIIEWCRTLKPTGNLLLNFQPQTIDGVLSPTAWLLPQALVSNGFFIVQELSIVKTNAMPSNSPRLLKPCVERVIHAVKDPVTYVVDKDAVRRPSLWASRDNRPWKYRAEGADGGNFICTALERLNRMTVKDVLSAVCSEDANTLFSTATRDQSTVHPARMADEVAEWLVRYGAPLNGVVGDSFLGSGTTAIAARRLGRHFIGSDLNADYVVQAQEAIGRVSFGEYLSSPMSSKSIDIRRPRRVASAPQRAQSGRCRHCQKEFIPKKDWQTSCSNSCRIQFNNNHRRKHDKQTSEA